MTLGAIEAGGTKFVCATGNEQGDVFDRVSIPTTTPAETMAAVDDYFTTHPVDAIGIGSFGPIGVNPDTPKYGYITTTPKPGWGDFNFLGHLQAKFDMPLYWTTDVNEAAYGEAEMGIAKDVPNSIYMTIGTGVGAGVIANNRIFNGRTHTELGHMRINRLPGDDFKSACPYHDICLEGLAAGPAVGQRTGKAGKDVAADDPVWAIVADYIAQACVNLTVSFAPDKIILNGGVMKQKQLFPLIHEKFQSYLNGYEEVPPLAEYIVPAGLGDNSGVVGGLLLAKLALTEA
ncbi:fructokinase [Lactiplantibacillus fabifermentans]|uniref:Fructokinase n=2 Tax=Lactiplantibacillus fabifermentans TaxID=483011 RepID=A0A0R2NUS3_9LACO|nr:fructokinase [Lactiplantibacillus fabifermentans]ETY75601.1 fructokinase [Lactiplantibacillus fabifermentans T30PCM01]KRO28498.1 fructokinase [Lactiplantibacillus fabifermentans DSM 21115]